MYLYIINLLTFPSFFCIQWVSLPLSILFSTFFAMSANLILLFCYTQLVSLHLYFSIMSTSSMTSDVFLCSAGELNLPICVFSATSANLTTSAVFFCTQPASVLLPVYTLFKTASQLTYFIMMFYTVGKFAFTTLHLSLQFQPTHLLVLFILFS